MKKNKAFTLIELLAVIIILAIIVLIATPIVLNVVEESKETARRSSISGYADGVRYAVYSDDYIYTGKYSEVNKEWAEANVEVSGDKVDCEEVRFSDSFETVLHKCRIGKSTKEYCYAGGKAYEDCEDKEYKSIYQSFFLKDLAQELIKQYSEDNTVGLLKDETGYYYKGTKEEVSNNFVWFAGHLWRITRIDNDNNLWMITQQSITAIQLSNTGWALQSIKYNNTYIGNWSNNVFLANMDEDDKEKIADRTIIRSTSKSGLLSASSYAKAGGQNSYLDIKNKFGLIDPATPSTIKYVKEDGLVSSSGPAHVLGVRPYIKVSNIIFTEGEGTLENPYREKSLTDRIEDVKVGEYISVPTSGNDCGSDKRCLFRVVSKENDSIKVILNGLLPTISATTIPYTSGNEVDTVLTEFANTIDNKYRYIGNKSFGIGKYSGNTANYKTVQNTKYTGTDENPANVGLPVIGEMFSGDDIDLSTTTDKIFVNVNTIENSTVLDKYWTMSAADDEKVRTVISSGGLGTLSSTELSGVRPVLFLNNNLNFISGEGTAENPFILE